MFGRMPWREVGGWVVLRRRRGGGQGVERWMVEGGHGE